MTEQENKPTAEQRKQAERNRDAAMRQRDLLNRSLEARRALTKIKAEHYKPGPDFKASLVFQQQDDFWAQSQIIDEVEDKLKIVELEGILAQLEDRIQAYTNLLKERA